MKVYGPYTRKDGRQHVILYKDGKRTTQSYPRYLMERKLNRKLNRREEVDHIDENVRNNSESNFQILTKAQNIRKSHKPVEVMMFICGVCGRKASKSASSIRHNRKQGKSGPFCSRQCAGMAKWQTHRA
jgi:signal recognition particle GTPase